jgi:hypothetical protein
MYWLQVPKPKCSHAHCCQNLMTNIVILEERDKGKKKIGICKVEHVSTLVVSKFHLWNNNEMKWKWCRFQEAKRLTGLKLHHGGFKLATLNMISSETKSNCVPQYQM